MCTPERREAWRGPAGGAVIGMVMGAHPELRSRAKEVSALAKEAIADVAALSPDERIATLQARAPDMYASLSEKHEHKKVLPDLEEAAGGGCHAVCPQSFRSPSHRACPGCSPERCLREAVRRAVYPAYRGYRSRSGSIPKHTRWLSRISSGSVSGSPIP